MELFQPILPLLGVIVGAAISGLGLIWRGRVQRKRVVAAALADLLEIRHHLITVNAVLGEFRKQIEVSAQMAQAVRMVAAQVAPLDPQLHSRFNAAVSTLATIDPVLAFSLRSKNQVQSFLDLFRGLSASAGLTSEQAEELESAICSIARPSLSDAAMRLAREHSRSTARRVAKIFKSENESPAELRAWVEQALKHVMSKPVGEG